MAAHGETGKVVLRVSVLTEPSVWHRGRPPTENTQEAEREAVKVEAMQRGPTERF